MLSGHATATINSSGASGNDGYGPKRLAEPSIASTLGTAATIRSTARARGDGSWEKPTDRRGPCLCVVVVRTRTRLMSVYPRGDRSRGQFFFDEEVLHFEIDSERLARLLPLLGSRYSRRTGYRCSSDSSFEHEFGE